MAINAFTLAMGENTVIEATNAETTVLTMDYCNKDSLPHYVDIFVCPQAGAKFYWLKNWKIEAGDTLTFTAEDKKILNIGSKIMAEADASNAIDVIVNYDEDVVI